MTDAWLRKKIGVCFHCFDCFVFFAVAVAVAEARGVEVTRLQ